MYDTAAVGLVNFYYFQLQIRCDYYYNKIILVITFMHGIYNYMPETNHVSRVHNVATVLYRVFHDFRA